MDVALRFDPPTDKGSISRLERQRRNLTLNSLAAYAEALRLKPAQLYRRPTDEVSLDELAAGADRELRQRARDMLAILLKPGGQG